MSEVICESGRSSEKETPVTVSQLGPKPLYQTPYYGIEKANGCIGSPFTMALVFKQLTLQK